MPTFRVGDEVQPGRAIAQVIDPSTMEVVATVGDRDRDRIQVGQLAEIQLDAQSGRILHGVVTTLGGTSTRQLWDEDTRSRFEVSISLTDSDPGLRPGLTAQTVIVGDRQKNVVYLPRQALFLKDGKHLVYVKNGSNYAPQEIKILALNESRAAIEGVNEGVAVALVDPTATAKNRGTTSVATKASGGTP
jgi:hypothetical protein